MLAYTYIEHGKFELQDKPKPVLLHDRDAIVRVTLSSICTSDGLSSRILRKHTGFLIIDWTM